MKPFYKMIENSAKSPPISTNEQPGFSGQSADETFSANNDSFTSNFNFKLPPFWSHDADSWLALDDAKFNIAGIKCASFKIHNNLRDINRRLT